MKTKAALQKKSQQPVSSVKNDTQKQQDIIKKEKKPNVRTTDYKKIEEIFLTDPDSVTREEFLFFQSAVGYRRAIQLLNEGKRRKQLRKIDGTGKTVKNIQQNKEQEKADTKQQGVIQKQRLSQVSQKNGNYPIQKKVSANNTSFSTSLPGNLRSGLENLSGINLSDVNVHKNSDKPQQVGALAYTQGNNIHIAPGQEKYLPHEGWHAVQQKQGRVAPTMQMKSGTHVNDDAGLEKEADVMGSKAVKKGSKSSIIKMNKPSYLKSLYHKVIQRVQGGSPKKSAKRTGAVNYKELNSDYWNRTDGYFDGFWWQDENKLKEATEVMRSEIRSTGSYKLNTNLGYKIMSDDPEEINKRMFAIQALSNALRTGYYDDCTLRQIENHMALHKMDFSNHTLDEKKLDIIIKRYGEIIFKESGNKLEGGWGDVIDGVMTLGTGYALNRGKVSILSGTKSNIENNVESIAEIVQSDNKQTTEGSAKTNNVKVNVGQQNKHIPGTNNYIQEIANGKTKSILSEDPQSLLDEFAGRGQKVGTNKECVDFGKTIGQYYDSATGTYTNTTKGIIHYDSKGQAHIVPARP